MNVYFILNTLIHQNKSLEEIGDFIRDNSISGQGYSTTSATPSRIANLSEEARRALTFYRCKAFRTAIFEDLAECPCPLFDAALAGRWDVMKALFAVGFSPHERYGCYLSYWDQLQWIQCSVVHLAIHGGLVMIRSLVEEYGVDINAEDIQQYTPLHYALELSLCGQHDPFPIVEYLVEAGADIDKEHKRLRPIHFAASRNCFNICQYLLSKGAKVLNETNPSGYPLWYAVNDENDLCIHLLIQNANNLNQQEVFRNGETLLHICVQNRLIESVKLLCSLGWDPDTQDDNGDSSLHFLTRWMGGSRNKLSILHYLITEQNASPHKKNNFDVTPFEFWKFPLFYFFHSVGYQVPRDVLEKIKHDTELLENILSSPRPLQDVCCFTVRRILGRRLHSAVESLPLPDKMKDFVRLRHVPIPRFCS